MNISKDWKIAIVFITLAFGVGYLTRYGCNKPTKSEFVIKDTSTLYMRSENAKFKSGNDKLSGQILLLSDSIEKLKGSLKTTKNEYDKKYQYYLGEAVVRAKIGLANINIVSGVDSMCLETLNWANYTITQQDSIITMQSNEIELYKVKTDVLNSQAKFNEDIATKCSKKEIDCCLLYTSDAADE